MIAGAYAITMKTPRGVEKGTLTLSEKNGVLNGTIRALGHTNAFAGGRTDGERFSFAGLLRFGLFKFHYTARGRVEGDTLTAVADTSYGSFELKGERIQRNHQ